MEQNQDGHGKNYVLHDKIWILSAKPLHLTKLHRFEKSFTQVYSTTAFDVLLIRLITSECASYDFKPSSF